ncbi:MAG: alpha/beta hydrolase [Spirochaetaceae bacterium]|nr:alpha/beta hydrolase [Spirochaetaceae bacterium]
MKEKWLFIHGGWAGSWQWTPITEILNSQNIDTLAPTMPGMGEPDASEITLDDHLIYLERLLNDVSHPINIASFCFGGLSATAFAGKYPEMIKKLVYIDAFIPKPGQSYSDLVGKKIFRQILNYTDFFGDNNMIPPFFEDDHRFCNHPLKTIYTKVNFNQEILNSLNPVYIQCTNKDPLWTTFTPILDKTVENIKKNDWLLKQIHSDHMPMFTHTKELCNILLE